MALLAAVILQALLPEPFVPSGADCRAGPAASGSTQLLLGLVAVNTAVSVGLLVHQITSGGHINPIELLTGGAEIWLTNAIVFGLWYWEYDRGGPASRVLRLADKPDLLFPQMTDPSLAKDWEPIVLDYFFVAYTNSTAFSPTA